MSKLSFPVLLVPNFFRSVVYVFMRAGEGCTMEVWESEEKKCLSSLIGGFISVNLLVSFKGPLKLKCQLWSRAHQMPLAAKRLCVTWTCVCVCVFVKLSALKSSSSNVPTCWVTSRLFEQSRHRAPKGNYISPLLRVCVCGTVCVCLYVLGPCFLVFWSESVDWNPPPTN